MSASLNGEIHVRVFARTDVGMIRRGNEDCFMVADLTTGNVGLTPEVSDHRCGALGSLLVVSDGMGGAVAGEIASDLAVNGVREEMAKAIHLPDVGDRLRQAVEVTNRLVWQHAQENPHLAGMGATLTAVLCHGGKAYVAQVGDSRAYLVREKRIKQLTKDQSLVQLLMDAKAIRPDQANQVPNNVILQALGTRAEVVVAMTSVDLCAGDYMLLCSDGLSNKMKADEMRDAVVQSGTDLAAACRRLIELANARGGEDNITALLARFDGSSLSSSHGAITDSLRELTSNDLLRIGGTQLDFYHDPAADVVPPAPDVPSMLDDMGVTLIPTQPNAPANGDPSVSNTQVAIPIVHAKPAPLPRAHPDAPDVVVPEVRLGAQPAPAPATPVASAAPPQHAAFPPTPAPAEPKSGGGGGKILVAFGVLMILTALLLGAAFTVYYVFFMKK